MPFIYFVEVYNRILLVDLECRKLRNKYFRGKNSGLECGLWEQMEGEEEFEVGDLANSMNDLSILRREAKLESAFDDGTTWTKELGTR